MNVPSATPAGPSGLASATENPRLTIDSARATRAVTRIQPAPANSHHAVSVIAVSPRAPGKQHQHGDRLAEIARRSSLTPQADRSGLAMIVRTRAIGSATASETRVPSMRSSESRLLWLLLARLDASGKNTCDSGFMARRLICASLSPTA